VVRDLASTLDTDDFDAALCELCRSRQDVLIRGMPTQRQDRLVLYQQQHIGSVTGITRGMRGALPVPRLAIRYAAEPLDLELHARTVSRSGWRVVWRLSGKAS
jgi:hypothetical protein